MTTPDRNARRRIQRFENSSFAARALRLTKGAQSRIRELLISGDGREARKLTTELDAQRRTKERDRSRVRREAARAGVGSLAAIIAALHRTEVTDRENGSHSGPEVSSLEDAIGNSGAREILREQLESTRAYVRGEVQPGRDRWYARDMRFEGLRRANGNNGLHLPSSYDKFFWYHGKRI